MILTSLQENGHVARLLGFSRSCDQFSGNIQCQRPSVHQSLQLAEMLMRTLLRNLTFHAVSNANNFINILVIINVFKAPNSFIWPEFLFSGKWLIASTFVNAFYSLVICFTVNDQPVTVNDGFALSRSVCANKAPHKLHIMALYLGALSLSRSVCFC